MLLRRMCLVHVCQAKNRFLNFWSCLPNDGRSGYCGVAQQPNHGIPSIYTCSPALWQQYEPLVNVCGDDMAKYYDFLNRIPSGMYTYQILKQLRDTQPLMLWWSYEWPQHMIIQ